MNDIKALADFDGDMFDEDAILKWARDDSGGGLPVESAVPFSQWLDSVWNEYDDESGDQTNEDVLKGALAYWKGES